jgi:hypothetical protein
MQGGGLDAHALFPNDGSYWLAGIVTTGADPLAPNSADRVSDEIFGSTGGFTASSYSMPMSSFRAADGGMLVLVDAVAGRRVGVPLPELA